MSLTLANLASNVLRNVQIPEDSSAPSVQALADAKAYINERVRAVWEEVNLWREYIILGSYTIPANTRGILLSNIVPDSDFSTSGNGYNAMFYEICAIREGSNPLMPEDPSAIQKIDPTLWANTTTPVQFMNRGQNGIMLYGQYSTATKLSFFGKAGYQNLADAETWTLDPFGKAIQAGATGDMLRDHERDNNRANIRYQEYQQEVLKLIKAQRQTGADIQRVVPINPWTADTNRNVYETSKIGIASPL